MGTTSDAKFFDSASSSAFNWDTYLSARPDYEQSNFYDVIWGYHTQHHGQWKTVYDVGTGPGNVAKILASKFEQVYASDIAASNVEEAKRRYHELQNVDFQQSRAEDITGPLADLITAAECFPLMDMELAMSTFVKMIKPGGTLAIWFYGAPIFTDPGTAAMQRLQRDIIRKGFDVVDKKPHAWTTIVSWLDSVKMAPEHWQNVKRIKWNSDQPLEFCDDMELDPHVTSAVRPEESVEKRADRDFWHKEVDVESVKGFVDANVPRPKSYITPEVAEMYAMLEKMMDGKKWAITWPVVLILATRRLF